MVVVYFIICLRVDCRSDIVTTILIWNLTELSFPVKVFALFNNVAYGVGAYFLYLDWKSHPVDTHMQPPI